MQLYPERQGYVHFWRKTGENVLLPLSELADGPNPEGLEDARGTGPDWSFLEQRIGSQGQTNDRFISEDLRQMLLAPRYNEWLFSLIKPFLGTRVMEIGCGIGAVTGKILGAVDFLVGVEPNGECRKELGKRLGADPRFHLIPTTIETCNLHELSALRVDTAVLVNVLEHIRDDRALIGRLSAFLHPGARIVLLVPACSRAYGTIDRAVGHFRRYDRTALAALLTDAGLSIECLRYSNLVGLFGWFFNNRIRRLPNQNNSQIHVYDRLVPVLSRLERMFPPPLGMSLLGVARKREEKIDV